MPASGDSWRPWHRFEMNSGLPVSSSPQKKLQSLIYMCFVSRCRLTGPTDDYFVISTFSTHIALWSFSRDMCIQMANSLPFCAVCRVRNHFHQSSRIRYTDLPLKNAHGCLHLSRAIVFSDVYATLQHQIAHTYDSKPTILYSCDKRLSGCVALNHGV